MYPEINVRQSACMVRRICRTYLLGIFVGQFCRQKCPAKFFRQSIYLSTKCSTKKLPAKYPCRTKCRTNLAGKMFNKALFCRTWNLSELFSTRNAGKNCFVEQNVEQSINLSTRICFVEHCNVRHDVEQSIYLLSEVFAGKMSNKAYICRQICFCSTIVRQKAYSCRQRFRQRKKRCRQIYALSDKMFNKAYSCRQRFRQEYAFVGQNVQQSIYLLSEVFCWGGGQLFGYTMGPAGPAGSGRLASCLTSHTSGIPMMFST